MVQNRIVCYPKPGMKKHPILIASCIAALFLACAGSKPSQVGAGPYLPEDWTLTYEPTHPTYWGGNWGEENFLLPYRILQRGKHEAESRWASNWRFRSKRGGASAISIRQIFPR